MLGVGFDQMAKAGNEYQEIVGTVVRALDPNATVRVSQWIEGPDGRRDMDVEVRGTADGQQHFILVECKDWTKPVGIGVIDALESKMRDLGADLAVIYSNSGFTKAALRKAQRIGIEAASSLRANDKRIRIALHRKLVAKCLSIDSWELKVFPAPGEVFEMPDGCGPLDLKYNGLPVVNWIHTISQQLLNEHEGKRKIEAKYAFHKDEEFFIGDTRVILSGLLLVFTCSKKWFAQTIRPEITLGLFDHLRKRVIVPNQQAYFLGWINNEKWHEIDEGWDERELEANDFQLQLTLYRLVDPIVNTGTPPIEELIVASDIHSY